MYLGLPSFVSNAQPGKRASRSRGEQRLDNEGMAKFMLDVTLVYVYREE